MKKRFKRYLLTFLRSVPFDYLMVPLVFCAAIVLYVVRVIGLKYLVKCKSTLIFVGVLPVRNHYYEPLFDKKNLSNQLSDNRKLPGIDWNVHEQLTLLEQFQYNQELDLIPDTYVDDLTFHYENGSFEPGDAEYWYNIIRYKKPSKIIEIGSGNSTKMARLAIEKNKNDNPLYSCEHICIEPFEKPWLEQMDITLLRQKVENTDISVFKRLEENDILFIDSSHVIRPQGDVVYEYLEILPQLNKGVIVHIHDIFTPKDYPEEWVFGDIRLWNEQYMLEAFLTTNQSWKVIAALNLLRHDYYDKLKRKCPKLTPKREPGSFYICKTV
ncbi:MAG TPA: class I SAM-dependent methyltransferase [Spirochaetota bacterium]|nr:class I SAM-dependent methyltransferase [Spirochaetota bacterium]